MASRNYGSFTRGKVTIEDYFEWQARSATPSCADSENPAFISARASEQEIVAAKATCAGCPLMQGCDFFAHTKHFRDFDGVMGGNLYENAMDDDNEASEVLDENLVTV